jgi:hypothetical protein
MHPNCKINPNPASPGDDEARRDAAPLRVEPQFTVRVSWEARQGRQVAEDESRTRMAEVLSFAYVRTEIPSRCVD